MQNPSLEIIIIAVFSETPQKKKNVHIVPLYWSQCYRKTQVQFLIGHRDSVSIVYQLQLTIAQAFF